MNAFREKLVEWYKENGRELPWRGTQDPYRIWISEIVLQQTRVAQGYDYYCRFVERFPDVFALAEASEDEVMKYWQGLGYYSRARNLHAAARQMAEQDGFPTTYEGVRALKGVGDYTAAAICSFAYGLPHAVVDGNVYRVLSRWFGIDTPIDSTPGKKMFASLADELLDRQHPAVYNQAIMDFGALQCTPASPRCDHCPLSDSCVAYAQATVDSLPVKQHKTKVSNRYLNYIYVRTGAHTFIHKRSGNDIWKNLYEPPLIETETAWSEAELYASEAFRAWVPEGVEPQVRLVRAGVKHILSHRVLHVNFYELVLPEDVPVPAGYQRISHDDVHKFAVSRLVNQFFSLILSPDY